jgi:hypothetical protein
MTCGDEGELDYFLAQICWGGILAWIARKVENCGIRRVEPESRRAESPPGRRPEEQKAIKCMLRLRRQGKSLPLIADGMKDTLTPPSYVGLRALLGPVSRSQVDDLDLMRQPASGIRLPAMHQAPFWREIKWPPRPSRTPWLFEKTRVAESVGAAQGEHRNKSIMSKTAGAGLQPNAPALRRLLFATLLAVARKIAHSLCELALAQAFFIGRREPAL